GNVVRDDEIEVAAHFVGELTIDRVGPEERPKAHAKTSKPTHSGARLKARVPSARCGARGFSRAWRRDAQVDWDRHAVLTTRVIAAARRSHDAASLSSCFRPTRVSE